MSKFETLQGTLISSKPLIDNGLISDEIDPFAPVQIIKDI